MIIFDFSWSTEFNEIRLYINKDPSAHLTDKLSIYLNHKYLALNSGGDIYSFLLFSNSESKASAIFQLVSNDLIDWYSLPKAPFGGIQFTERTLEKDALLLLKCAENFVKSVGGKTITIKSAAEQYNTITNQELGNYHVRAGYRAIHTHTNHIIPVTSVPFMDKIKNQEYRRLKKNHSAGFDVMQVSNEQSVSAYHSMRFMRDELGYATSISCVEFERLIRTFPDKVRMFVVSDENKVIAVTVIIRVNDNVVYNFLSGYDAGYRQFSPMVLLMERVYQICQNENVAMLDLGVSLDGLGNEKSSLIRFKENIGAQACNKITWHKSLDS